MYEKGICPDLYTYCSVFNAISVVKCTGFIRSVFKTSVSNAIVDAYAKCELLEDVRTTFDRREERDIVSWTTLVVAYSQCSEYEEALKTFSKMREDGFIPNQFTFSTVLD
ncbi:hypothetical protein F8388_023059 [Cannabis sativa]|uniref:Pentatricopeptide repeat-containing protein n=1 Tax=Cannabis sativa TaxID=3483 RepID=A0A7J6FEW0_CANSA|nr:hypothetical protein F8388_023059 [Cannabis sativa]KAF4397810.1 hypothetical protein G4B88_017291 [Cannabis sativa]